MRAEAGCAVGEIYSGLHTTLWQANDGAALLHALVAATDTSADPDSAQSVLALLLRLRGPYAFAFWHAERQRLFLARDPLGRRSLLLRHVPGQLVVSSGAPALEEPDAGHAGGATEATARLVQASDFVELRPGLHLVEQLDDQTDHRQPSLTECSPAQAPAWGGRSLCDDAQFLQWQRQLHQERPSELVLPPEMTAAPPPEVLLGTPLPCVPGQSHPEPAGNTPAEARQELVARWQTHADTVVTEALQRAVHEQCAAIDVRPQSSSAWRAPCPLTLSAVTLQHVHI